MPTIRPQPGRPICPTSWETPRHRLCIGLLTFVAFDILRLNGRSLLDYEHTGRRRLLERLVRLSDGALTSVATFDGDDLDDVLASCDQLEMEGVVMKRRTSVYRPGRRSEIGRASCRERVSECV